MRMQVCCRCACLSSFARTCLLSQLVKFRSSACSLQAKAFGDTYLLCTGFVVENNINMQINRLCDPLSVSLVLHANMHEHMHISVPIHHKDRCFGAS